MSQTAYYSTILFQTGAEKGHLDHLAKYEDSLFGGKTQMAVHSAITYITSDVVEVPRRG